MIGHGGSNVAPTPRPKQDVMLTRALAYFPPIAWLEGVSLLVLFGIAMPLKYMAGMPMAVRWVGSIHGLFFGIYCILLGAAWMHCGWSLKKVATYFVAALVPFGTFMIDKSLRESLPQRAEPAI